MIIKKVLSNITGISLVATSVALIGAAAAPYISPASFELTAFLGLMYPFLLLLHLALFVCYFLIKKSKQSLIFLAPPLITVQIFLNSFGLNCFKSETALKGNTVRLITYNVHMFKASNNLNESVQVPILALLKNEQPDILCLQDLQTDLNTIDTIKAILKAAYFYDGPTDRQVFPTKSIAIFSKYPIVNTGFIVLSETSPVNQAIFTDINKNGKIIRVYNVHFESLGFAPYVYDEWRNADIIGKFEFLFKVKDKFSIAFAHRSEQVKMVKEHTKTSTCPFIIAGDFNDTPSSFAVNYTTSGMKNAFREKGRGYTVTFNGGLPDFQIDYVLVKPFFEVLNYAVIQKKLSDHYPVVVNLGF